MYTPNISLRRDYPNTRIEYRRFVSREFIDNNVLLYGISIPISNYTISSILVEGPIPSKLNLLIDGDRYFSDVTWTDIISDDQITSINYTDIIKFPLGISKYNPFPLYRLQLDITTDKEISILIELNTIEETELNKLIQGIGINHILYDIQLFKSGDVIKYKKCAIQRISFQTPSITIEYDDIKSSYVSSNINTLNTIANREKFLIATAYLTNNISNTTMGITYDSEVSNILSTSSPCYLWLAFDKISHPQEKEDKT